MTTLDAICPNYEVVFPENGEPLLTFDLADVPVQLPRRVVDFTVGPEGLSIGFEDANRRVRVHFESLPAAVRDQLSHRSSLLVAALDEQGVAFANEVAVDWPKPRRGVKM